MSPNTNLIFICAYHPQCICNQWKQRKVSPTPPPVAPKPKRDMMEALREAERVRREVRDISRLSSCDSKKSWSLASTPSPTGFSPGGFSPGPLSPEVDTVCTIKLGACLRMILFFHFGLTHFDRLVASEVFDSGVV